MNIVTVIQKVDVEEVIDRLFEYMAEQGHAPQSPDFETEVLDRQIFESGCCLECGCDDVKFYPFFKATPRSYRPFVVCGECGWEREV